MSQSSFIGENGGRSVRIRGTKFVEPARLTLKLEGVRRTGYRTICLAGIRDPFVIEHLSEVEEKVRAKIKRDLPQFEAEKAYKILCRHCLRTCPISHSAYGICGPPSKQRKPGIFVHTGRISRSAMLRVRPLPFDGGRGSGKTISDHLDSEIGEEIS